MGIEFTVYLKVPADVKVSQIVPLMTFIIILTENQQLEYVWWPRPFILTGIKEN